MRAAFFTANGQIMRVVEAPAGMVSLQLRPGEDWCEAPGDVDDSSHYVLGHQAVPKPVQPSRHHVFDFERKAWVDPRTLEDLRAERWTVIRQQRDRVEFGGFVWDGSTFDSDAISQSRIQGAAQMASIAAAAGQPFSIDWTLADNTVRQLSGEQMTQVGLAMGQHIASCHAISRALRAQIQAASSASQLDAISWPA